MQIRILASRLALLLCCPVLLQLYSLQSAFGCTGAGVGTLLEQSEKFQARASAHALLNTNKRTTTQKERIPLRSPKRPAWNTSTPAQLVNTQGKAVTTQESNAVH